MLPTNMTQTVNTFGDWLQEVLNEKGLTQSDLANAAHVGRSSISDVISGRRQVGKDLATSIAKALKLPLEQVFRVAGFLPPEDDIDPWVEEMAYKLNSLPPGMRDVATRFIDSMVEGLDDNHKTSPKPKRSES